MERTILADLTKYPEIYEHTYWGQFEQEDLDEEEEIDQIIKNRNKFIDDYNIQTYCKRFPQFLMEEIDREKSIAFDHVEYYLSTDGDYVLLNSPYYLPEGEQDKLESTGWALIYKLYNNNAKTFAKVIPKKSFGKF